MHTILIALVLFSLSLGLTEAKRHPKERKLAPSAYSPPPPGHKLNLGSSSGSSTNPDVLIIGAGISGLAAARTLLTSKPTLNVLIIEVRYNPDQLVVALMRLLILLHLSIQA